MYFTDKEQQLERVVNELPDEPVTRAVLEGFSRTSMVDTFSNKLHAPGVVFRRDANPLVGYVCEDDNEREPESPPAILPVENHVDMATISMDLTAFYQNQVNIDIPCDCHVITVSNTSQDTRIENRKWATRRRFDR